MICLPLLFCRVRTDKGIAKIAWREIIIIYYYLFKLQMGFYSVAVVLQ
jgi:hypothetical protein